MRGFLGVGLKIGYGAGAARGKLRRAIAAGVLAVLAAIAVAPALAGPVRIVALGDSLTQGYGLAAEDGLVPRLQDWLAAHGVDAVVINAGVSGDTTAGGRARLDWTLADRPDAMIVALGGNDLLRGIDPAASRANLDAILSRLAAEGVPTLLVGLHPPGNYGSEFRDAFAAIFPDLAAAHGALLLPDLLAPITERVLAGREAGDLLQADGLHPSAAGVALVVEALGPAVLELIARVGAGS